MSVDRTSDKWKKKREAHLKKILKARALNAGKNVKMHYVDEELLNLITDADFLPKMPKDILGKFQADERRAFCLVVDTRPLDTEKAFRKATTDRPENAVRARLESIAPLLGKTRYYAVRSMPYKSGLTPCVYIVRV